MTVENNRFDTLSRGLAAGASRRHLLARLAGGILVAPLIVAHEGSAATKRQRRKKKRCLRQQRAFCAGRCCPPGQACEDRSCFETCPTPFSCANLNGGLTCADTAACFCGQTAAGAGACVASLSGTGTSCDDLPECSRDEDCAAGHLCATCDCDEDTQTDGFRCQALCFAT